MKLQETRAMRLMAAAEVLIVGCAVTLFIWRLQFTFPDFAWFILGFLIFTFLLHRDSLRGLGLGTHGFLPALKRLTLPTAIIAAVLLIIGMATRTIPVSTPGRYGIAGFARYFAWSLLQEFGLQSFFTNRIFQVLNDRKQS